MGGRGDEVALSEWERGVLADLEAGLRRDDPELERRLGGAGRRQRREPSPFRRPLPPRARAALAAAVVLLGVVVTLATFTISPWLGLAGVALMGAGGGVLLEGLARGLRLHHVRLPRARGVRGPGGLT